MFARGFLALLSLAVFQGLVQAQAQPAAAQAEVAAKFPTVLGKIDLAAGDTVVFLGDSITHQCLYTQYLENYFVTRYPGARMHFHNAGVGGDRCADALARFDADVAKYKPKYVTVLLGMNDGSYQPFNQSVFDTYENGVKQVIEKIQGIGAIPVLMGPTMFDAQAARLRPQAGDPQRNRYYNSVLAYYSALLREEATVRGLGYVDMYTPLNTLTLEQRKTKPEFTLIADAVHPGPAGQAVMAYSVLEQLHANRSVSRVSVSLAPNGKATGRGANAEVTEVAYADQELRFVVQAAALPWVLPADAAEGYELTKAGHRMSNEKLIVHGLPAGKYELVIDDHPVGTYPHTALAGGIELQANPETPQYQQAAVVAALNQERNDKVIRPLRGIWSARKGLRRLEAQAAADPANANLAAQLAKQKESLADADAKIAEFDTQNEAMLAKMYEAAQPKPRRYVLRLAGK